MKMLKEVFNTAYTKGAIFTRLNEMFDLTFLQEADSVIDIDRDFFSQYGRRRVSLLVDDLLNDESIYDNLDYVINDDGEYVVVFSNNVKVTYSNIEKAFIDILCDIIYTRYHYQWEHLYATLKVEYNPINNYDMIETENVGSETETTASSNNDESTKNNNYGFNSSTSTPVNESSTDNNASSTAKVSSDFDKNKRVLTRSGNIGVTTSAQMLEQEHNVWKYDFYKTIFKNVADVLTLPIYF